MLRCCSAAAARYTLWRHSTTASQCRLYNRAMSVSSVLTVCILALVCVLCVSSPVPVRVQAAPSTLTYFNLYPYSNLSTFDVFTGHNVPKLHANGSMQCEMFGQICTYTIPEWIDRNATLNMTVTAATVPPKSHGTAYLTQSAPALRDVSSNAFMWAMSYTSSPFGLLANNMGVLAYSSESAAPLQHGYIRYMILHVAQMTPILECIATLRNKLMVTVKLTYGVPSIIDYPAHDGIVSILFPAPGGPPFGSIAVPDTVKAGDVVLSTVYTDQNGGIYGVPFVLTP